MRTFLIHDINGTKFVEFNEVIDLYKTLYQLEKVAEAAKKWKSRRGSHARNVKELFDAIAFLELEDARNFQ